MPTTLVRLSLVPSPAAVRPAGTACGAGAWAAYWYAWQRARQLAAVRTIAFDPRWN